MSLAELEKEVQNLSLGELQAFTRWLTEYVESLPGDQAQQAAIGEGVRRIEDIIKGHVTGLTESQFRAALR